jgi:hypothetical protein
VLSIQDGTELIRVLLKLNSQIIVQLFRDVKAYSCWVYIILLQEKVMV